MAWLKSEPGSVDARGRPGLGECGRAPQLAGGHGQRGTAPGNRPAGSAARALALHSAGRDDQALARLDQQAPELQLVRRVGLVRGGVQAELGRRADSAAALTAASSGPLVPEESALLQAAKSRNLAQ